LIGWLASWLVGCWLLAGVCVDLYCVAWCF
jgi:hypothetical protein